MCDETAVARYIPGKPYTVFVCCCSGLLLRVFQIAVNVVLQFLFSSYVDLDLWQYPEISSKLAPWLTTAVTQFSNQLP